jgi:uncharacterized peroxidase-related enzyme
MGVANILKVMSRDAAVLEGSMALYVNLMKSSNSLSEARREMLAAVVSNINDCYYWTLSHATEFGRAAGDSEAAQQLVFDYLGTNLPDADRLLCDYAVKLTLALGAVGEADLTLLRKAGFDDDGLSIAVQVISYFKYINRIADGLGVDREEWMTPTVEDWREKKGSDYWGGGEAFSFSCWIGLTGLLFTSAPSPSAWTATALESSE